MMYSYTCILGYVSYTFQMFLNISLSIPNFQKALFNNIIFENFKSENLEWIKLCRKTVKYYFIKKNKDL